jgi:hypothetical protein
MRAEGEDLVQARATIGLNWLWIGIALTILMTLGLLGAMVFWWRQRDALIGNVVGAGLIGACVLLFIWREYLDLARVRASCGSGTSRAGFARPISIAMRSTAPSDSRR